MSESSIMVWRVVVRGTLVAFATVGLLAALHFIAVTSPTPNSVYPKCISHRVTGLHCPGCGTGRAVHFALNGEFLCAIRANVFSVVLLPIILFRTAVWGVRWALGLPPHRRTVLGARWIWLLVALLVLFTICRNIPLEPFSFLAPTELS